MNFNIRYQPVKTEEQKRHLSATMKEVCVDRNQDPEYLKKLRHAVKHTRDNSYQAECNARPEVKSKISKALSGKSKTEEHKKSLRATTTNKPGNIDWESAHKAGLARRDKPFHAGEYGVFQSRSEAARYASTQGLKNALKRFEAWTKSKPNEYYFIDT